MVDVFGQERGVLRQGARRQCLGVDVVHEHIGGDHELFEECLCEVLGGKSFEHVGNHEFSQMRAGAFIAQHVSQRRYRVHNLAAVRAGRIPQLRVF